MADKILITGGSGFIGTNLMNSLLLQGYEILNIDLEASPVNEFKKYTTICDIRHKERTVELIRQFSPDYIVHLAARTDLDGKTLDDYSANTVGVRNMVEIANMLPSLKKILITSSMLVCKAGYQPRNQDDYCPTTVYGASKVETEKITKDTNLSCSWAFIRPTSIWGPWFKVPYRNFFDMVRSRRYFHIGHKSCTKTYGYVGNAVYQLECILFSDTTNNPDKVYYLGDSPTNIEEWANEIAAAEQHKIYRMPLWVLQLAALFGDILKYVGIGFPMTSFRLKNMTTNNIVDLSNTDRIAPSRPYSRIDGVQKTLQWLNTQQK